MTDKINDKINTMWISGMTQEEAKAFSGLLYNRYDDGVLIRLRNVIAKKREAIEASERDPRIYDSASWAHAQAHNNGARQMLKLVEDLLSFVK